MDDWDTTFATLRRAYLDRTPDLTDAAQAALDVLIREPGSQSSLSDLHRGFHTMVGSAGTYGFTSIAEAATEGERLSRSLLDAKTSIPVTDLEKLGQQIERIRSLAADASSKSMAAAQGDAPIETDAQSN